MNLLLTCVVVFLINFAAYAEIDEATNCGPTKDIFDTFVNKYDAEATIGGIIITPTGKQMMSIWQTFDGSKWTMVKTDNAGTTCIIASGTNIKIVPVLGINPKTNI